MEDLKRKLGPSSMDGAKRPKTSASSSSTAKQDVFRMEMVLLEEETMASSTNLNNISKMMDQLQRSQSLECRIAMSTMCRTFCRLVAKGSFNSSGDSSGNGTLVAKWLKARLEEFRATLVELIFTMDLETSALAVDLYMQLLQTECMHTSNNSSTKLVLERTSTLILSILRSQHGEQLQDRYMASLADKYFDIRCYTIRSIG
jgi:U3 small nucleolar RNA-associated protein 19